MLGYEDRMPSHWSLPAVVLRMGVRQPLDNKTPAVLQNYGKGLLVEIRRFLGRKLKATAERAPCQGRKQLVGVAQ